MKWFAHIFLSAAFLCVSAAYSEAATLYMDPNQAEVKRGDTIMVSVRLDTGDEECVNAIDGVIKYTENIEPIDVSRGSSILSVWVEDPKIDKVNHTITFAGGIPNGYCGRIPGDPGLTNTLVDILFMSPGLQVGSTESGNVARIEFADETRILLNDGFGTDASRQLFNAELILTREAGSQQQNEWLGIINSDDQPPEDFTISLERTQNAFSNKYFIVFNTTDKQSGLAYYEVMEEPSEFRHMFMWGRADAPWKQVRSPYVLEDQSLNSTIRVRAVDKTGNEYLATLVPDEASRGIPTEFYVIGAAIATALILLCVFVFFAVRALSRRRKQSVAEDDEYEDDAEE